MIKAGIDILYRDLKGGLSLYEVKEQKSKRDFFIKQKAKFCRENIKNPKGFDSTPKDKNGNYRLFPLWLEFEKKYILMSKGLAKYVVLQSYIYMETGIHFDFYEKATGKLFTLNFEDCCRCVLFDNN